MKDLTEDKMMKRTAIVPEMKILFRLPRLRREYMKRRKTLSPDGHPGRRGCTVPVRKAWTSNLSYTASESKTKCRLHLYLNMFSLR